MQMFSKVELAIFARLQSVNTIYTITKLYNSSFSVFHHDLSGEHGDSARTELTSWGEGSGSQGVASVKYRHRMDGQKPHSRMECQHIGWGAVVQESQRTKKKSCLQNRQGNGLSSLCFQTKMNFSFFKKTPSVTLNKLRDMKTKQTTLLFLPNVLFVFFSERKWKIFLDLPSRWKMN